MSESGKAAGYDYLIEELESEEKLIEERIVKIDKDLDTAWDYTAGLLIGRKYILMEQLATIERWRKDAEFIREQSGV